MLRFFCPACHTLLQVPPERAGCKAACGRCGQHLLAPTPVRAAATASVAACRRTPATLEVINPDDVELARWRAWAAQVRDSQGVHRGVSPEAAERGGALAKLLDAWQALSRRRGRPESAANLTSGLESAVEMLIKALLCAGVTPPEEVAGPEGSPCTG